MFYVCECSLNSEWMFRAFVACWEQTFLLALKLWRQFNGLLDRISGVIWRLCEVHVFKVVAFAIFFCCVDEVSLVFDNCTLVLTFCGSHLGPPGSLAYAIFACEIILFRNNFEIILVFYLTCNHVWNWNWIILAAKIMSALLTVLENIHELQ